MSIQSFVYNVFSSYKNNGDHYKNRHTHKQAPSWMAKPAMLNNNYASYELIYKSKVWATYIVGFVLRPSALPSNSKITILESFPPSLTGLVPVWANLSHVISSKTTVHDISSALPAYWAYTIHPYLSPSFLFSLFLLCFPLIIHTWGIRRQHHGAYLNILPCHSPRMQISCKQPSTEHANKMLIINTRRWCLWFECSIFL